MRESYIEQQVCKYAEKRGCYVRKYGGSRGDPDRIFIYNGSVMFIEFKTTKGVLSKIQEHRISELRSHKINVHVVDNIMEGRRMIENFINNIY